MGVPRRGTAKRSAQRCVGTQYGVSTSVAARTRSVSAPAGSDRAVVRTTSCVGYYVHHHGLGHLTRYRAIRDAASFPVHPISELAEIGDDRCGRVLPSDVDSRATNVDPNSASERPVDPTAGGTLHWAPLTSATGAGRLARFVDWLDELRPAGIVVDVSVEAALTCRLGGFPTVVVRQHGRRTDTAHELAYRQATRLVAPWPSRLEHPGTPDWVLAKTDHVGFVWGTEHDVPHLASQFVEPGPDDVVVLWGAGGGHLDHDAVRTLGAAVPGGTVFLAGSCFADTRAQWEDNVVALGWVERPEILLAGRPTVVASAGNNTIAAAARFGCPLVVVPQERPFDEQVEHARRLDAIGAAAVVQDPNGATWERLVDVARQRAPTLAALAEPGGAARAVGVIETAFGEGCR